VDQLGVLRVVIVLLGFDARIGNVIDLDVQPEFSASRFNHLSQMKDGEALGELVVDSAFALGGGIVASDLDAADGVANAQEAASLAASAIDSQRLADGRLHAEAIEHGAEDVVVVEAIDKRIVLRSLVGHGAIDDALIEIGGANAPDFAGKHHVV